MHTKYILTNHQSAKDEKDINNLATLSAKLDPESSCTWKGSKMAYESTWNYNHKFEWDK